MVRILIQECKRRCKLSSLIKNKGEVLQNNMRLFAKLYENTKNYLRRDINKKMFNLKAPLFSEVDICIVLSFKKANIIFISSLPFQR